MRLYCKLFVVVLGALSALGGEIDHECISDKIAAEHLKDPKVRKHKEKNEKHWEMVKDITGGHTGKWNKAHGKESETRRRLQGFDGNIDIPIVFHVLYNNINPIDNVEDYSIFVDRLENINLNFNEANNDISDDPFWNNRAGNMDMTFYINKIIYRDVGNNSPFNWNGDNIKSTALGGSDPFDEDHNLNVYFVRPTAANQYSSAYASFPWDDDTIGIVFNIGLINGDWAQFDWGQFHTIFTHEMGHWTGLYHIWGCCTAGDVASCAVDDEVVDTSNMGNKWGNICPADGSNSCGGDAESDNFENFMSYASCINMFTDGQVARARANFVAGGDRSGFISYQTNPASSTFVNMIYFVNINNDCMLGDAKKTIYNANNGGQYALCVSYSDNPYIDVYEDIKIIQGNPANTACPNTYSKIDNNLKNGGVDYFVCYKKVPQSSDTVIDVALRDLNVDITTISPVESCQIEGYGSNFYFAYNADLSPYNNRPVYTNDEGTRWISYYNDYYGWLVSPNYPPTTYFSQCKAKENMKDCDILNGFHCVYSLVAYASNGDFFLDDKEYNNRKVFRNSNSDRFISYYNAVFGWIISPSYPPISYYAQCVQANLFECTWWTGMGRPPAAVAIPINLPNAHIAANVDYMKPIRLPNADFVNAIPLPNVGKENAILIPQFYFYLMAIIGLLIFVVLILIFAFCYIFCKNKMDSKHTGYKSVVTYAQSDA